MLITGVLSNLKFTLIVSPVFYYFALYICNLNKMEFFSVRLTYTPGMLYTTKLFDVLTVTCKAS